MLPSAAVHGTTITARSGGARRRFPAAAVLAAGTALVLAGCSGQSGNARVDTADAGGDGTLRIGLILDNTGKQSFLNASQLAAAKLAVEEINAAGGHKGRPVELLPAEIGEDTIARAKELVAAKADVVIGPTDSSRAPGAIDVLARAKVAMISPANSAHGLSRYRSGGYYFRTSAADVAQAPVLVKLAKDGGARTLTVVHEEGSYGKDVSVAVAAAAKAAGLGIVADAEFAPGQTQQAAAATKAAGPDAVILVARSGAQGAIAELNNEGLAGKKLVLSDGAINQYGSALGSNALDGARGILPGVFPSAHFQAELVAVDPALQDMTFAAETYDAVNLAAIAAAAAQDDAGSSIAAKLISVSGGSAKSGGTVPSAAAGAPADAASVCKNYRECVDAIKAGKPADYDGESGRVGFDDNGDVTSANYMVFTYGPDNKARMSGSETAARTGG
ncbi:ABC transporter substrate-binding protein [Arthrobacter oryzae]|uniref:ABC transporter substrate-binding protein n=1 Tax=Arthrobacter oryzae TaxID=409290 RepID=UPI00277FB926|nr:ABC transporter substrate-binding protein [Arthrobacter oryzae]MDQ0077053.1 branched-chain amino acid transport system substrate-binding protein [Arthrobacter oryzae]